MNTTNCHWWDSLRRDPREIIFRKNTPRLIGILLLHQKIPRPGFRVPGEGINKRMIRIGKGEFDCVPVTRPVSEGLGRPATKEIKPLDHIAFLRRLPANKYGGF